jgi:hypothetical protein
MEKRFTATLSRSQGRNAWAAIFRHPVRVDPNTNKVGLRVRQGLGTTSETEARELVEKLNHLLEDPTFWNISARKSAEERFPPRVVEIFYHGMEPEESDFGVIRDSIIPLPNSRDSDYRSALLLGTTGAGKTTVLRQLIGTDQQTERFPSTSTAKTTVHETEVILAPGLYEAAITFFPMDEVREHLDDCIAEAVLTAYRRESDADVMEKLLQHVNQRFRFNYLLGNGAALNDEDDDEEQDEAPLLADEDAVADAIDMQATNALLAGSLSVVRAIAAKHGGALKAELGAQDEKDQRVVDELFEESFGRILREDDEFHALSDRLMDEIELRFKLLEAEGEVRRGKQGWPKSWSWQTEDRNAFIKAVTRFSGNHAKRFGRLLTPLVNGVRVSGPFCPEWNEGVQPRLVLFDGEGLGHTPKSVAAISTSVVRRIQKCDAVILVDDATQPMQAAPVAAMKEMISSGGASKLMLVFTHFDEVGGDNLPNFGARQRHVLASAENVLASIGEDLGPYAERALRGRLKDGCFFVAEMDKQLNPSKKSQRRTIGQLQDLLAAIDAVVERPAPVPVKPVYSRMNLVLAVKSAAEGFHDAWWPRLGLSSKPGVSKENWKRIWALTRRLQTPGWSDEYDNLKPVADLRTQLQSKLYVLLQNPIRWTPNDPTDDAEKLQIFDAIAEALARRVQDLAAERVRGARMPEWQLAFSQSGRGSSYLRASIIGERIYERAAPVPDVIPSPDRNSFLNDVAALVEDVCAEMAAQLE